MVNPLAEASDDDDGMQVEGTLGTIDQSAIQAGLGRPLQQIAACFDERQRTEPYLGGQVSFQFRVARDGKVKRVKLKQSTLGSFAAERCMVQAAAQATFRRPRGGEAEFSYSLAFQGRATPTTWDPGMVRAEIDKNKESLLAADGSDTVAMVAPAGLQITMIVDPKGRCISAGMTAVEDMEQELGERLVEGLKTIQFEQPQTSYAKVTFTW